MSVWYWVFLVLSLVLVLNFVQPKLNFKNINESDVYSNARTGDLLLFRWHSVDLIHNFISFFTHVGIVVELDNKKYILETHREGDTVNMGVYDGGVKLYDLKERIRMYEGHNFLLPLKEKYRNKNHQEIIKNNLKNYIKLPFFDNYKEYYMRQCLPRMLCKSCFSEPPPDTQLNYCSQFVGIVLRDLGILNKGTNVNCISPYDFIFIKNNGDKLYEDVIYRITK